MARRYASLIEFQRRFPDEVSCALFVFERRWPDGFTCPACGGTRSWPLKSRAYTYECIACGQQTSVTAGTIMHRTKLPLTTWFWAAHLMATHSNGMSAQQLMGQLGLCSYKTAWLLAQKLRRSMVDPDRDPLEGVVEVDQTEMPLRADDDPDTPLKTGKIIVIGAVEVIDRATGKAQRPKALGQKYLDTLSGRIRLAAIPSNHATHIHAFIKANIAPGATLITDGHASYSGLPGYRHDPRVVGNMAAHIPLRWIHQAPEALEPWNLSRPPSPAHRRLSQRVRLPVQPPLLSACLLRDDPRTGSPPPSHVLLGYHRPPEPPQGCDANTAEPPPTQDRQRYAAPRPPQPPKLGSLGQRIKPSEVRAC